MVLPDGTTHPLTPERKGQGVEFDSLKEARHWLVLVERQRRGEISFLRRQCRIRIKVNGEVACVYVADFVFMERGRQVVQDVKSPMTLKLPVYRLKKKLLRIALGIDIVEV